MKTRGLVPHVLTALLILIAFQPPHSFAGSLPDTGTLSLRDQPPRAYAVVIKQTTYLDPLWHPVADALLAKYDGRVFTWSTSLSEVQTDLGAYRPTHIAFVCELATASPSFIQSSIWPLTRALDGDLYCDAIWGIVTGYDPQDALRLVTGSDGFEVKTLLSGTSSCDLSYHTQGISTNEATYGLYYVKYPDSLGTTAFTDGPTDRTEWLVTMINEGIDIFDYAPVDIFYTSGHGGHNYWQLHYPSSGLEGFFRSGNGQVYGDPHDGANININSDHPRIYFGLGNCDIGQILSISSMAPSWIHTGGAYQYTGYLIGEGGSSHQHGGTKAYFYKAAREYTWAESFFLANQALRFDMLNNTPGANPPDLNGSALYGDPGLQVTMSHEGVYREPLFDRELLVRYGADQDTVTFRMTMNREGNPGFTSKWGERHPAIILPFRAENVSVIYTDAMVAVVEDDFALMYVWYQGQASLAEGETREVVFICDDAIVVDVEEDPADVAGSTRGLLLRTDPNPFHRGTRISYALPTAGRVRVEVFDIRGRVVHTIVDEYREAGLHSVPWDAADMTAGIYFCRVSAGELSATGKCLMVR